MMGGRTDRSWVCSGRTSLSKSLLTLLQHITATVLQFKTASATDGRPMQTLGSPQAALDRPNCGEPLAAVGVTLGPLFALATKARYSWVGLSFSLSVWRNGVSKWNPPPAPWASRPGEEIWAGRTGQGRTQNDDGSPPLFYANLPTI